MSPEVYWHAGEIDRAARWAAAGVRGSTVWLTGLSGSGKSTVAFAVERRLAARGVLAYVLDADNLRHGLNADLGFDERSRHENVRRTAEVARLLADAGVVALVPVISPYAAGRAEARRLHDDAGLPFLEVHVATPLAECEARDPKGLYARARNGEIKEFTGIDAPYEAPEAPDLRLEPGSLDDQAGAVVGMLAEAGLVAEANAP